MNHHRRRLALAALATTVAVVLSGCSDQDPTTTATAPEPSASASASESADPLEEATENPSEAPTATPGTPTISYDKDGNPDYCENQAEATGPAAKEFGGQEVLDAYCQMVTLTMDVTFQSNMLRPVEGERNAIEFSRVEPYLTTDLRKAWQEDVQEAVAPGEVPDEANSNLLGLMFFDVTNPDMVFPEDESTPIVFNKRFSGGTTEVIKRDGGEKVLKLTFDIDADLAMVDKKTGEDYRLPVGKTISYFLKQMPSEDTPWLIDGYTADFRVGDRFDPEERKQG